MLLKLRDQATERGYSPAWITSGLWLFRQLATRPRLFRRAQALASFATRLDARDGWIRRMPGHFGRWTRTRDFPAFAPESFMSQWGRHQR